MYLSNVKSFYSYESIIQNMLLIKRINRVQKMDLSGCLHS